MRIDFDPAKNQLNIVKHHISLAFAGDLEWDDALVWIDVRYAYPELRMLALVPAGSRLFYVSFVDNDDVRRIISLRFATRREIKHYVKNYH